MKRLLTALLALIGLLGAPACFAIGPYLTGTPLPAGELPALMAQLEQKLRADGFNVVGRHLPRGLFAVATVGDQRQLVGAEHHPTVRAREAGEPANVGEVADEQCLGAGVRQPGPHTLGTLRGGHAAANLRTTACTASS